MVRKNKGSRSSSSQRNKGESKGKQIDRSYGELPQSQLFLQNLFESFKELSSSEKTENQGPEDEWNNPMVLELEKLLLKDLEFIFQGAIRKIVKLGYTEEEAQLAVFNVGNTLELIDTKRNIIESDFRSEYSETNMVQTSFAFLKTSVKLVFDRALDDLKDKKDVSTDEPPMFKDLSSVVSHFMLLMVNLLKKVKPDLSVAEAIWYLLITDSNFLLLLLAAEFKMPFENVILEYNDLNITEKGGNPSCSTTTGSASKREIPKQKPQLLFGKGKKGHSNKYVSKANVDNSIKTLKIAKKVLASLDSTLKIIGGHCGKITYEKAPKKYAPQDEQDVILMVLNNKFAELKKEDENWLKWATEKDNQVNGRLKKIETEVKKLKAETDKAAKANWPKRAIVLEGILANIKGRVEVAETLKANTEVENKQLKKSLKDKKSEAAEICEAVKESEIKEQDLLKGLQNEEKNNNSLLEELKNLKAHREGIESNLNKEKALLKQEEGRVAEVALKKEEDYVKKINKMQTRYVMRYRHSEGKLVLKVTDDKECLKFKTDQARDTKKMEKLNNISSTMIRRVLRPLHKEAPLWGFVNRAIHFLRGGRGAAGGGGGAVGGGAAAEGAAEGAGAAASGNEDGDDGNRRQFPFCHHATIHMEHIVATWFIQVGQVSIQSAGTDFVDEVVRPFFRSILTPYTMSLSVEEINMVHPYFVPYEQIRDLYPARQALIPFNYLRNMPLDMLPDVPDGVISSFSTFRLYFGLPEDRRSLLRLGIWRRFAFSLLHIEGFPSSIVGRLGLASPSWVPPFLLMMRGVLDTIYIQLAVITVIQALRQGQRYTCRIVRFRLRGREFIQLAVSTAIQVLSRGREVEVFQLAIEIISRLHRDYPEDFTDDIIRFTRIFLTVLDQRDHRRYNVEDAYRQIFTSVQFTFYVLRYHYRGRVPRSVWSFVIAILRMLPPRRSV